MELKDYKIIDFKKEIFERNKNNKKLVIKEIKKNYKDIFLFNKGISDNNSGYGKGDYQYDFVWLDGIYNEMNFRICFYTQDIDLNSQNIHIYHGNYTFQKNLIKNNGPYSLFSKNMNCQKSFEMASKNIQLSSYQADNFCLQGFMQELLDFLNKGNIMNLLSNDYFLIDKAFAEISNSKYPKNENEIVKFYYYKDLATKLNIDIDVSKNVVLGYKFAYKNMYKKYHLQKQGKGLHKWELVSDDEKFIIRGDTMISPYILFNLYGIKNLEDMNDYINNDENLKELIEKTINLCYDFGNFLPIPYNKNKNTSLNNKKTKWCKEKIDINNKNELDDSFYVFLICIYNYYHPNDLIQLEGFNQLANKYSDLLAQNYKEWLDSFVKWDNFIQKNYLKFFCENNRPKKIFQKNMKLKDALVVINDILEKRKDAIKNDILNEEGKKKMKIEIEKYQDIEKLRNNLENEFIVNLEKSDLKNRTRIIDFLGGMIFQKGSLKKLNKDEYEVIIEK